MKHIHLIGIGGSGLSAIARVLLESGYTVSGSDRILSPLAIDLEKSGVKVFQGHNEKNISGADLIVRSSAVPDTNPEVMAARTAGIPVQKRSDFLGDLVSIQPDGSKRTVLAISGTHGKTTSTAMVAWMLKRLGLDPSYIIGGISKNLSGNAHAGNGKYFVIEADEYDNMFLGLSPDIIMLTNVQHDHPDCFPTREIYLEAYKKFVEKLNPAGKAIACAEDVGALQILKHAPGPYHFTYGFNEKSDYHISNLKINENGGYTFDVDYNPLVTAPDIAPFENTVTVSLKVPGKHNVLNATGALAVVHQLHLPKPIAKWTAALSEFSGTGRRFDIRGVAQNITVVDDYAHHPVEIKATINAARDGYPGKTIWVVWQPHTFSRIKAMFDEFLHAFDEADRVLITDIYAAREKDDSFTAKNIIEKMDHPGLKYTPALDDATQYLTTHLKEGDVLLVLSAGDAEKISADVLSELQKGER